MNHVAQASSRICLFGEHQDYLDLAVLAGAIDLCFTAQATPRSDNVLRLSIRSRAINTLNQANPGIYDHFSYYSDQLQRYSGQRDYFKSTLNVLLRHGFALQGCDVVMDSNIPIGKGMSSSSVMIVALMKALLLNCGSSAAYNPTLLAELAWEAEVFEFDEPGGRMDHYMAALPGMMHLDFSHGSTRVEPLAPKLRGTFLLFDSLQPKDTFTALSSAKEPTLSAMRKAGIAHISHLLPLQDTTLNTICEPLSPLEARCLRAQVTNAALFQEALALMRSDEVDDVRLGALLTAHHRQLADGLCLSTPPLEAILSTAMQHGAYGGKLNGSGGGGCAFVYAPQDRAHDILGAVFELGYPGRIIHIAT